MNRIFRKLTLTAGMICILALSGNALADDTEIYVGSNLVTSVSPNVLFIIDTSGSMQTQDVPSAATTAPAGPYDATQTYTGSCDNSSIYFVTSGQSIPTSCNSFTAKFSASAFTCAASAAVNLGSSANTLTGKYTDTFSSYYTRTRNGTTTTRWRTVRSGATNVVCQSDYSAPYPWGGNSSAMTLYSGNWMNWYLYNGGNGGSGTSSCPTGCITRLSAVQQAFAALLNSTSGINAALMRYSSNGNGGYFVTPMLPLTSANRTTLITEANNFTANGSTPLADTLYEASLFYRGLGVKYGDSSTPAHNVSGVENPAGTYVSPIKYQCQKNFVVQLTDGAPTNDTGSNTDILNLTGGTACTGNAPGGGNTNPDCMSDLAGWMYTHDMSPSLNGKQNVSIYTIGVLTNNVPLLQEAANAGGGKYYLISNDTQLNTAFSSILTNILSINSTFVAPAVAVNAFNRLTNRSDLYFSVFKPNDVPDWRGNVKHYRLDSNHPPVLVDANGNSAVDASTGFFSGSAQSIWSTAVDGDDVALGGAASLLTTSRTLYTYTGSTPPNNEVLAGNPADVFNESNTNITTSLLGLPATTTATDVSNLLQWARGVDVLDYNNNGSTTDSRQQLGDILHSVPVLMTYGGSNANPDITLFVGDNEGFIHAINAIDGSETFGFIPKELLPNLNTLFNNDPGAAHPYGMDGPLTLWHNDVNHDGVLLDTAGAVEPGEFVYLYAGMRRGGNSYYSLDVTNRTSPVLKWQITGGSSGTTGFAELGQTWSRPIKTKIELNGVVKDVLLFGGGYDTAEDSATTPQADTIGRAIYMIDASTGQLLWWASSDTGASLVLPQMTNSIPSDLSVIDINGDGIADFLYAGDMGGRIWRIDFSKTNTGAANLATGGILAELGGSVSPTAADNRHFYYAPDVALVTRPTGNALAVTIGSGYRAHPLDNTIEDRLYTIFDTNIYNPPPKVGGVTVYPDYKESDLYDATADTLNTATGAALVTAHNALNAAHGWYIRLEGASGTTIGEKVLSTSNIFAGHVLFTTFTPVATTQANSCAPSTGTAKVYAVNLLDGTAVTDTDQNGTVNATDRAQVLASTGIPPEVSIIFTGGGDIVPMIGATPMPAFIPPGGKTDVAVPRTVPPVQLNYWKQTK